MDNPFAKGAPIWRMQGWAGTLLLPHGQKSPPPTNFTGHLGLDPDDEQVEAWAMQGGNIGIRLPKGVVGIDVDWYKPEGEVSYSTLVNECGPLPPTYKSSARPTLPHSGVYLYRVDWQLKLHDKPANGIEIIQFHHRYICTWPSIHPEGGMYRLTDPNGKMGVRPPLIDELPWLPEPWLKKLVQVERPAGVAKPLSTTGGWSPAVTRLYAETQIALSGAGRHDSMRHGVDGLTRLEYQGHPGATEAREMLGVQFTNAVINDGTRTPAEAHSELQRMLDGARELVESTPSYRSSYQDLRSQGTAMGTAPVAPWEGDQGEQEESPYDRALRRYRANHFRGNALDNIEPLTPIVEGLLDKGTLAIVLGEPGSGKSQLVLDLAAHVVLGKQWANRETRQGVVVYFVGEGQYGIRLRVLAWCALHGHHEGEWDDMDPRALEVPIDWVTVSPNLLDVTFDTLAALQFVAEIQPDLVVIDTLNRAIPGGDENSPQDMGKVILFAERIREICGATTLYVHHLGKDTTRGARGHSSLNGAADTVLLVKAGEGNMRQVHLEKQKDHPDDYDIWWRSLQAAGSIGVVYEPQAPKLVPDALAAEELAMLRILFTLGGSATVGDWKEAILDNGLAPSGRAAERPIRKLKRLGMVDRDGTGPKSLYSLTPVGLGLVG